MNTCKANHFTGEGEQLVFDADTNEWYCPDCNQVFEPFTD